MYVLFVSPGPIKSVTGDIDTVKPTPVKLLSWKLKFSIAQSTISLIPLFPCVMKTAALLFSELVWGPFILCFSVTLIGCDSKIIWNLGYLSLTKNCVIHVCYGKALAWFPTSELFWSKKTNLYKWPTKGWWNVRNSSNRINTYISV